MPVRKPMSSKRSLLVLCLSMLTLQNGIATQGGNAEAPASNANAVSLAPSTTTGVPAVVADGRSSLRDSPLQVTNGSGASNVRRVRHVRHDCRGALRVARA